MRSCVETVCGPVPIDALGFTLTHEHLWVDATRVYFKSYGAERMRDEKITRENRAAVLRDLQTVVFGYKDNVILDEPDVMADELRAYAACGGRTLFEVTSIDLGRDPVRLRELSRQSGVQIIMGGTYYYFPSIPPETRAILLEQGKNALADRMIREFYEGVGDTGVKPGVLGELGLQYRPETDDVLLRAALIAQRETGAPLIIHAAPYEALDAAEEEGADLEKIVMGHWTMNEQVERVVKRGAWVAFDQFGMNFPGIIGDERRMDDVMQMFERGWEGRLLLSQDVAWKVRLRKYGGEGLCGMMQRILPRLRQRGLTEAQLRGLFCENPKRLLR